MYERVEFLIDFMMKKHKSRPYKVYPSRFGAKFFVLCVDRYEFLTNIMV